MVTIPEVVAIMAPREHEDGEDPRPKTAQDNPKAIPATPPNEGTPKMTQENSHEFFEYVKAQIADNNVAALVTESEMIPLAGPGSVIAPPTYAPKEKGVKAPTFALSHSTPVPQRDDTGWYQQTQRDPETASIRLAPQVIVDSVGSQSGRAEAALLDAGAPVPNPPGIFVGNPDEGIVDEETPDDAVSLGSKTSDIPSDQSTLAAQQRVALANQISTWTTAHRQADAWIKFAQTPDGKQVWEGGALEDGTVVKDLIISANAANGDLLYSLFPNSAVYGYWLSSGTARRHRMPRAYSSQVVGYAATPVVIGSTMMDESGGASGSSQVTVKDHRLSTVKKGKKPSDVGFGPVPSSPEVRGFSCELILQRATISLAVLRQIRFENTQRAHAAQTVLTLMAMLGHALANQDGFYRSGCALVTTANKWGWRRYDQGGMIEDFETPSTQTLKGALEIAIKEAADIGLEFRAPIQLVFSEAQETLIKERVANEDEKQGADKNDGE